MKSIFVKYVVAGLACNGLNMGLYYLFTLALKIDPRRALFMSCALVFPIAYLANRYWTFRSDAGWIASIAKYGAGYGASLLLQMGILHVGTFVLGLPHYLVAPGGLVISVGFFFVVQKYLVFKAASPRTSG